MQIKYLSKTQIKMYQRCPFQYYCRYVQGLKIPPSSALLVGKSFDEAINLEYQTKKEKGKDEKVSTLQDCFAEIFDREKDNTLFTGEERPEELKDIGIETIACFYKEICPQVEPQEVQKKDYLSFENVGYQLVVVVDVVDRRGIVIDNKTAKRSWSNGQAFKELDPVIYSLWYEATKGEQEQMFRFDIGVMTKSPKTQQVERKVSREEKAGFLKYMGTVYDSIQHDLKRGLFLPRDDHFLCSKKSCGYWELCQKEWGKVIKD